MPFNLVAAIVGDVLAKDGDPLAEKQEADPELRPMMQYLSLGDLPEEEQSARKLIPPPPLISPC